MTLKLNAPSTRVSESHQPQASDRPSPRHQPSKKRKRRKKLARQISLKTWRSTITVEVKSLLVATRYCKSERELSSAVYSKGLKTLLGG